MTEINKIAENFAVNKDQVQKCSDIIQDVFDICAEDAEQFLVDGFMNGLDAKGEFLENILEYAPHDAFAILKLNRYILYELLNRKAKQVFFDKNDEYIKLPLI